jgi:hypothetical protein
VFPVTRCSPPCTTDAGSFPTLFYTDATPALRQEAERVYQVGMVMPGPDPDNYPPIDPDEPVPDDPGPLSPDTPETLPPAPVEPMPGPDDPDSVPAGEPEPA